MRQIILFLISFTLIHLPLKAEEYLFKGKHFLASYLECDEEALRNVEALKAAFLEAAKASRASVLDKADFVFEPDGLTMVLLLSESHASIHTYPEHHACFIDLFTCGDKCLSSAFDKVLREYLKPGKVNCCELMRADQIEVLPLNQ